MPTTGTFFSSLRLCLSVPPPTHFRLRLRRHYVHVRFLVGTKGRWDLRPSPFLPGRDLRSLFRTGPGASVGQPETLAFLW